MTLQKDFNAWGVFLIFIYEIYISDVISVLLVNSIIRFNWCLISFTIIASGWYDTFTQLILSFFDFTETSREI